MQPERDRQQVPGIFERAEMSSASSTELHLSSPQREEDQLQEDHSLGPEKILFILKCPNSEKGDEITNISRVENFQLFHFHKENSDKNLHFQLIENPRNSYFLFLPPGRSAGDETANIQYLPCTNPLENKLSDFKLIWLKYSINGQRNCCNLIDNLNDIMKLGSNAESIDAVYAGEYLKHKLKYYHKKHLGKDKQFAFAVVFRKSCEKVFSFDAYSQSDNVTVKHSEEILIGKIDEYLEEYGQDVSRIFIYTYNSPCLMREREDLVPCMVQLLEKACQWHIQYDVFTSVAFTKYWGLRGPNFFKDLKSSKSPCSDSTICIEICRKRPLKSERNDIQNIDMYQTLGYAKGSNMKELNDAIKTVMCNQETHDPSTVQNKHFEHSTKKKEKIILSYFNTAAVKLFAKHLRSIFGDSCPLQLYQVVEQVME